MGLDRVVVICYAWMHVCIGGVMEFSVLVLVHMKLRRSEQTGSKRCLLFVLYARSS